MTDHDRIPSNAQASANTGHDLAKQPVTFGEMRNLLFELRDSDLVTRYPTETAELLIYLCNCAVGYHAADLRIVAARLPALAPTLQRHLDEAQARLG